MELTRDHIDFRTDQQSTSAAMTGADRSATYMMTTAPTAPAAPSRPQPPTIGFPYLLRSEWTKLRSVRSTCWIAAIAALVTVALGIFICARTAYNIERGQLSLDGFDPTLTSLTGIYIAQVAVGALGVLTISGEYGTGMIRATLAAVPQRRAMLAAKGLVFSPRP